MSVRDGWAEVEIWVTVDESGDYGIGKEADTANEHYQDAIGGPLPRRMVKVLLQVELPKEVELTGEAPLVGTGAKLVVAK